MGYTAVKSYTDKQLLDRVATLPSFKGFPKDYWILGVRSKKDTPDVYDDKFYIFKGKEFVSVMTGTTNSGSYGLRNFQLWNSRGTAHIKADEWYYDVWHRGRHYGSSGNVEALRQDNRPFKVIRDNNKNLKAGDSGNWSVETGTGLNFHPGSYNLNSRIISWIIGGWSTGCQVVNDIPRFKAFLEYTKGQNVFTYCLIDEF